jgi:hypothetical protein
MRWNNYMNPVFNSIRYYRTDKLSDGTFYNIHKEGSRWVLTRHTGEGDGSEIGRYKSVKDAKSAADNNHFNEGV